MDMRVSEEDGAVFVVLFTEMREANWYDVPLLFMTEDVLCGRRPDVVLKVATSG